MKLELAQRGEAVLVVDVVPLVAVVGAAQESAHVHALDALWAAGQSHCHLGAADVGRPVRHLPVGLLGVVD